MDKNNKIEAMMRMVMRQKTEEASSVDEQQQRDREEEIAVNLKKRSRSLSSETEMINNQGKRSY